MLFYRWTDNANPVSLGSFTLLVYGVRAGSSQLASVCVVWIRRITAGMLPDITSQKED